MNYPYTSGIVKSLENKLLTREKLFKLKKVDRNDFVKSLKELDFGFNEDETLEELIHSETKKIKDLIDELSPNKKLTDLFYLTQDDLNTKILCKSLKFGISYEGILSDLGSLDAEKIIKIIFENDYSELKKSEEKLYKSINELVKKDISSKDLSIEIDKMFYEYAIKSCSSNNILLKYYKTLIDKANITMFIRCRLLGWSKEQFSLMVIAKGNISSEDLTSMYDLDNDALVEKIKSYYNEKVSGILKTYFINNDFSKLENSLDELLIEVVKEFRDDALNIGPLLYYYVSKLSEIKNIRLIYSNKEVQLNDLLLY